LEILMAEPNPVIELIRGLTGNAVQSTGSLAAARTRAATQTTDLISEQVDLVRDVAAARQIQVSAERSAQMAAQDQATQIISGNRGMETLSKLLGETTRVADEVVGLTQTVRKEQETRLIDDPITWIKAQVDWNNNQEKLQGAMGQLQVVQAAAQSVASQIGQVGEKSKALARTITQVGIQAENDQIRLTAEGQRANLAIEGIKLNLGGVEAAANADDRMLQLATSIYGVERAEAQFQLGLEAAERDRARDTAARRKDEDDRQFEERMVATIRAGQESRGVLPESAQQIKDKVRAMGGVRDEYKDYYDKGEIYLRSGQAILGYSPGESAAILSKDPTLLENLNANQRKVADVLAEATKVLGDKAVRTKEGLDDDKTGAKARRVVADQTNQLIQRQLAFVGNNPDNPFYVGDLSAYIGSSKAPGISTFQNYPITKLVLNPAIESGVSLADPSVVYKLALGAVKEGKITSIQAAADLTNIYTRAGAINRAATDWRRFGISLPPNAGQYKVKINGEVVNLTDFPSVANAMARQLRIDAFNEKLSQRNVPAGFLGRMNKE
jgi:hypothetical protein